MKVSVIVLLVSIFPNCFNTSNISHPPKITPVSYVNRAVENNIRMNDMFGINTYEWDFLLDPDNPSKSSTIFEPNMSLIKTFSAVRHYMDWEKIEDSPGKYTFNPTRRGGWNYDAIYERCKKEGILVLSCLKEAPDWLYNTYPEGQRDANNIPAPYGSNLEDPTSYIAQAKAAFQFAARYGSNKNIDPALVHVNSTPRWTDDPVNEVKIGLDLIKYIEADNERDRWWLKDKRGFQTGRQYAAHLSAFYDGHKGTLGKNVGVKTADPSMKVVMGGLAKADPGYVKEMIEWCKENRGYRSDGSIDLCFDVINYHLYSNDNKSTQWGEATRGVAPELSELGKVADAFVELSKQYANNMDVWMTEAGYDLNAGSPQRAIPIGDKSALITQADWILRSSLLYARHGIRKVFYYQLFDDNPANPIQYASSGLAGNLKRRPATDYIYQVSNLMGEFTYKETISNDPLVDVYVLGTRKIYVLVIPDEKNRTGTYELILSGSKNATLYHPRAGTDKMKLVKVPVQNDKVRIEVTETPVFVEAEY